MIDMKFPREPTIHSSEAHEIATSQTSVIALSLQS
jgi:hypothetical protein